MLKVLLHLACVLTAVLAAPGAKANPIACAPGDRVVGPNCVHEERIKNSNPDFEWVYSQVYRLSEWHFKVLVWDGEVGEVLFSTERFLVVRVIMQGRGGGPSEEVLTFTWNGSKYE